MRQGLHQCGAGGKNRGESWKRQVATADWAIGLGPRGNAKLNVLVGHPVKSSS